MNVEENENYNDETSAKHSEAQETAITKESKIVYPSILRMTFIIISLSLSMFLVALDRTIVNVAMLVIPTTI